VNGLDFEAASRIYEESFPLSERQPLHAVKKWIAAARYQLIVGEEEAIVLMAFLWRLQGTDFTLLDYLAVRKEWRGRGLGAQFLTQVLAQMNECGEHLLLELEDPEEGDRAARERRIAFYRGLGARELQGVRYFLPPLGTLEATRMRLYVLPGLDAGALDGDLVRSLIAQLYRELHERDGADPLLAETLSTVSDVVRLA